MVVSAAVVAGFNFLGGVRVDRPDLGFAFIARHPRGIHSTESELQPDVCLWLKRAMPEVYIYVRVSRGLPRSPKEAADESQDRRRVQERKLSWLERKPLSFGDQPGVLLLFHDGTPGFIFVHDSKDEYYFCWVTTHGDFTYEFVAYGKDRDAVEREARKVFSTIRFTDAPASPAPNPRRARPPRD